MAETEISITEAFISQNYKPAKSADAADFTISTKKLFEKVENIMPGACTGTELYSIMLRLGYKLHDIGDLEMEWMVKRV
jgi:hypothetical protein